MTMRVTHEVNLLDGVCEEDAHLLQGRYRVYWTRLPGCAMKSFGVVDLNNQGNGLPLQDFVVLDAQQSDGRRHAARVATSANNLDATAGLLGLRIQVQAVAP
jgi:hypothetical protein